MSDTAHTSAPEPASPPPASPSAETAPSASAAAASGTSGAPVGVRVRTLLSGVKVLDVLGGVVLLGLLGYAVSTDPSFRWKPHLAPPPSTAAGTASETGAAPAPGELSVARFSALPPGCLRVSLLRAGDYARASDGQVLNAVLPEELSRLRVPPATYGVVFRYRDQPLPAQIAVVQPGERVSLSPSRRELAQIEYAEGLAHPGTGRNPDVSYFRRVLRLKPDHVNAHLQLAAYELARGNIYLAQWHVDAVRHVDRANPDAGRVQRLIHNLQHRRRRWG